MSTAFSRLDGTAQVPAVRRTQHRDSGHSAIGAIAAPQLQANGVQHRNAVSDAIDSMVYMATVSTSSPSGAFASNVPPETSYGDMEEEIHRLNQRIRELEHTADSSGQRIRELKAELSLSRAAHHNDGGLPIPIPLSTPQSTPTFDEEWHARTKARIKVFCSLNRAGSALCAWHISRRERRAYPPRMAPPNYLSCGCTYEEALFEESLARHGVGSYLPGENVRIDPAVRKPLLKLLQERYGYRDGEFERDPRTGNWVEGEGAIAWIQRGPSGGALHSRRARLDNGQR